MKTIENFHSKEFFEKSINATYIALIPKKKGAKELRDFRPISLIGSVYKIISKMLTERLKSVTNKLVDEQQMAFIKGRQIVDAALIANECVDSRQKGQKPGILSKLDLEKAFDHVNWNFLIKIMKDMGFGSKWLKWILFCIIALSDDSLILCDAEVDQLRHIRLILTVFEATYGLHVNWTKSQLFPINVVSHMHILAGTLACEIGSLPTTYLGMTLGAKKKLWRYGMRVVLVNSVLDSIPTYVMSLFPLPAKVEKRMDTIRRNFIWQGNKETKAFHLVKWKNVISSKVNGGLGIRNLRLHNRTLLFKWLWRYNHEQQALWRKVIEAKYGQDSQWCTKRVTSSYGNTEVKLGNGRKAAFWDDNWIGHGPLKDQYPDLYLLASNPHAKVDEIRGQQGCKLNFRSRLNDWEVDRVATLINQIDQLQGLSDCEDSLVWKGQAPDISR
ncbi:PREDICTED: uncharacterized protein LOC109221911 [Nicotiana attenuata]|uniref:uncharacterized protein LOC109221911 n=1 Tax=Nicotiana attenuata TaxID=49451 RepID=UPI0009054EE9|nr:PREDICTED: uncharacterized protein LOC109221911 [Nicotiana attenuata]